jgi:WD40 repeat protein
MGVWIEGPEFRLYLQNAYCQAACFLQGSEVVVLPRFDTPKPYSPAQVQELLRKACKLTGAARARPISHEVSVQYARFSPDGLTAAALVSVADTPIDRMRLIDVATGTVIAECPLGDVAPHYSSGFHPDGGAVVIGGIGHGASEWDVRVGNQPVTLRGRKEGARGPSSSRGGRTDEVWGLAFSRDGRTLVSASDDWTLKFWDVASGRERGKPRKHGSLVTAVAYSPDGTLLASASYDRTIRLWDAETGKPLETLRGHTNRVRALAFSPDGSRLASGGEDREVRLWDVADRSPLSPPLIGHTGKLFSIAFSPDGKTLFTSAIDKTIRLWDMTTRKLRANWPSKDDVYALAVSPDGQTLAAADHGGTVTLWEVASGRSRASLAGHVGDVLGVAFSPDGRTLASAGRDQTVRLWDPVLAQELLILKGHQAPVHPVAFSPDGTILATGSYDGAIKLWRAPRPPR